MSFYRNYLENWLKKIEVTAKTVYDIGGGAKPVRSRVGVWEVKNYYIFDNGSELGEDFKSDYYADINEPMEIPNLICQPEVIFCLEVAEYWYDPVQAVKNIFNLLKKGGTAYISFPSIYPVHNPEDIDYLRYTKKAIEKLLKLAGFKKWQITPRVATLGRNSLSEFYRSEGMHPVKSDVVYDIGYLVRAEK